MTHDKLMKLIDDYACEVANAPSRPTPGRKLAIERIERARNAIIAELAKPNTQQAPQVPMTWAQRELVANRAETAMDNNLNLSWRDALMTETEAHHNIKEKP